MSSHSALAAAVRQGDVNQVKTLLQENPDLLRKDAEDAVGPLLHHAVETGNSELVQVLIENGADINARHQGGFTPLHVAAQRGEEPLIKILLEHMADINATTDDGQTPMELAIKHGHDAGKWFTL